MTRPLSFHSLTDSDVSALAEGNFTAAAIHRLSAAQASKNALLLEALRRAASHAGLTGRSAMFSDSMALLSDVQSGAPGVAAAVLGLPQFGFWTSGCLTRLRSSTNDAAAISPPALATEIAHLGCFAAVAALRAGRYCDITLPVTNGSVFLPSLGVARLGDPGEPEWAKLLIDRHGARVVAGQKSVIIPIGTDVTPSSQAGRWHPASRLRAQAGGLILDVLLEDSGSYLAGLGPPDELAAPQRRAWARRLRAAWRILARRHRPTAVGLALGLTTLVPLRDPGRGLPRSATSGLAWGAIALNLPGDAVSMAETLCHEFQHLVLAAVDDVTPLVTEGRSQLHYAPWRDDPRPLDALMQGTFAYWGLARFWREQRHVVQRRRRLWGETAFARDRHAALVAARSLANHQGLTEHGRVFANTMTSCLSRWQRDRVSPRADAMACEVATEHRLRWRLAHLHPDERAVDQLAQAWAAASPQAPAPLDVPVTLVPWRRSLPAYRTHLLDLRLRNPRLLRRELREGLATPPDIELLLGRAASAQAGYLDEIRGDVSTNAWVGLILARRRLTGRTSDWLMTERPEVAVAVYERIREITGTPPPADALVAWLSAT